MGCSDGNGERCPQLKDLMSVSAEHIRLLKLSD